MAQRPSFDMTKLSTPDKILLGGSFLLFIDSFLPWQRACATFLTIKICPSANAWSGSGGWAGVIMALLALALLVGGILMVAGVAMPTGVNVSQVLAGLTLGTVVFALLKFLLVIGNSAGFGAWFGLILALAIGYGGWMKMQESKATPPPPPTGFTP